MTLPRIHKRRQVADSPRTLHCLSLMLHSGATQDRTEAYPVATHGATPSLCPACELSSYPMSTYKAFSKRTLVTNEIGQCLPQRPQYSPATTRGFHPLQRSCPGMVTSMSYSSWAGAYRWLERWTQTLSPSCRRATHS